MQIVKLTYYKRTGKWYAKGEYNSKREHDFEIYSEVRHMSEKGWLPELASGRWDGYILVEPTNGVSGIVFAFMD